MKELNEGYRNARRFQMTYRIFSFFFFSVKDRNLFHRVDTMGNIFTSGIKDRNLFHRVDTIGRSNISTSGVANEMERSKFISSSAHHR